MNKAVFIFMCTAFLSACGGGSSSSGNSSANVTEQCVRSSSPGTFVNGCDFVVNANVVFGNAINMRLNVQPNGFLYNTAALQPDRVIVCRAPSTPSNDSRQCT